MRDTESRSVPKEDAYRILSEVIKHDFSRTKHPVKTSVLSKIIMEDLVTYHAKM